MNISKFILLTSCTTVLYKQSNAQDSINYEGKKYKLNREGGKTFIISASGQEVIITEKQPEFPGGIQGLYKNIAKYLRYPKTARKDRVQGRVVVSFIIAKTGFVESVSIY